jgi:hypothetical protein
MPFGHRQQICCEQIEITATDASIPDLAAVVLPLTAPDLPVVLWCRSPRLFHLPAFPQMAAISQKVVLDSEAFNDPAGILKEMSAALAMGRSLADLSWTRLTRWRELIAQIFENRAQLANLPGVSEVRISSCSKSPPVEAFYMAAWLMDGLEKIGAHARLRFDSAPGVASGELNRVDLIARDGPDSIASIVSIASIGLVEGHAAEVRVGGLVNRAVLPRPTDYALMREELSIPGRDAVFERTLAAAAKLAADETRP